MSAKQVFAATLGGIVSALLGGFLLAPVMLLVHADDGGDGWGLWILLMILSGIVGAAFSARWWARRHLA